MPSDRILTPDEQRFIRHLVREKGDVKKAEKKARLKTGQGNQLLKRVHVREEYDRRCEITVQEQARIDAKDIARKEETLEEILGPELCRLIKLDPEKFGGIKLKALTLGLVVSGKIRQGHTEALDRGATAVNSNVSIYTAAFDRTPTPTPVIAQPIQTLSEALPPAPALPAAQSSAKPKTTIRIY